MKSLIASAALSSDISPVRLYRRRTWRTSRSIRCGAWSTSPARKNRRRRRTAPAGSSSISTTAEASTTITTFALRAQDLGRRFLHMHRVLRFKRSSNSSIVAHVSPPRGLKEKSATSRSPIDFFRLPWPPDFVSWSRSAGPRRALLPPRPRFLQDATEPRKNG